MHHKERCQSRGPNFRGGNGKGPCGGRGQGGGHGHGGVPVLTYFDAEGLAEQIRLTFAVGGVHFVDRRLKDHDEFDLKMKQYAPHGQVPILEVDGQMIVQSAAILAYAARRANLVPDLPLDRDRARSMQSMLVELMSVGEALPQGGDPTERRAKLLAALGAKLPTICARIESTINPSANGWLFGDTLTYADIALHSAYRTWEMYAPEATRNLKEAYPKLYSVYEAVNNHPAVVKYRAEKTSQKPKLMYFNTDGLAAPIRWAFEIGGIEYEDIRFEQSQWPEIKATIPGGVVPALQYGDKEYLTESLAILIHAARRAGLLPWKDTEFAHAYSVSLTVAGLPALFTSLREATTDEAKAAAAKTIGNELVPALLKRLEAVVGLKQSKQGYVVGDRLSFADLGVASTMNLWSQRGHGVTVPGLWTDYPNCKKVYDLVMSHPVVARAAVRSPVAKPKLYYFDITARAEAIRQIFAYANIEYEDIRFTSKDWPEVYKPQCLTGKAPFLDIGTDRIYETIACTLYAGERANLIPRTAKGRAQAMALFSVFNGCLELRTKIYTAPEGPEREALKNTVRPEHEAAFAKTEAVLALTQSEEGFAVCNDLTYIDFFLAYETNWSLTSNWLKEGWEQKYPRMAKLMNVVLALRK